MNTWVTQIRELGELREAGLLTEEEFAEQKALVLPSATNADEAQPEELRNAEPAGQLSTQHDQVPTEPDTRTVAVGQQCPTCRQRVKPQGAFGRFAPGGKWFCEAHLKAWCQSCAHDERLQRGTFLRTPQPTWVCFDHEVENCSTCWKLVGEPPTDEAQPCERHGMQHCLTCNGGRWSNGEWTCDTHNLKWCKPCRGM